MPSVPNSATGAMSSVTWAAAKARVAGVIAMSRMPDALSAAGDAITETLEDWDTRHDWKYTQVVAPDIALSAGDTTFDLPTTFKKPYVAYLNTGKTTLWYVERANWHRAFPGDTSQAIGRFYTLYNDMSSGKGDIFPVVGAADTLTVLYYRNITYNDSDDALLDIPARWTGYILRGARALLTTGKSAGKKSDDWWALYERGCLKAREDDRRVPDQFLSFQPPSELSPNPVWNPNSTWRSTMGEC